MDSYLHAWHGKKNDTSLPRRKVHGQAWRDWQEQEEESYHGGLSDYGYRRPRVRASAGTQGFNRSGMIGGAVTTNLRVPRQQQARRRSEAGVKPHWQRDGGMGRQESARGDVQARKEDVRGDGRRTEQHAWSQYKRFVTFYVTNFPPQLSNFYLRKGFEVCGILEEVFVPRRRNANGDMFGFVRFSNMRDVGKLLKAVNAVYFGNYRVRAKLARFDRSVDGVGCCEKEVEVVVRKRVMDGGEGCKQAGKGGVNVSPGVTKQQLVEGVKTVMVGDVPVTVTDGKGCGGNGNDGGKSAHAAKGTGEVRGFHVLKKKNDVSKLLKVYRPSGDDLRWAHKGVVANVLNGEAITVVQTRVEDAGFADLDIIPLGADRVFLRSKTNKETMTVLGEAKEFFDHFLSNATRWDKDVVPFCRGAWLRLYGIPLHAWNETFFKIVRDGVWVFSSYGRCVAGSRAFRLCQGSDINSVVRNSLTRGSTVDR